MDKLESEYLLIREWDSPQYLQQLAQIIAHLIIECRLIVHCRFNGTGILQMDIQSKQLNYLLIYLSLGILELSTV